MKLLTKKAVREKIGFSSAHIDRLEADPNGFFPKRVKIGFRVFWVESELDEWILTQIAARDNS